MARTPQITEPVKVTLYMPKGVSEPAKSHAASLGMSLSQLVTELLSTSMSGKIQHTVLIEPDMNEALEQVASANGHTMAETIEKIVSETCRRSEP